MISQEAIMSIRPYHTRDGPALATIHNATRPEDQLTADGFTRRLQRLLNGDGQAWVIVQGQAPVGYSLIAPIPALEGLYDLWIAIDPAKQRRGFGSRLLRAIVTELKVSRVKQLCHPLEDMNAPAAAFLGKHGFFIEHIEWRMDLADLSQLPAVELPDGFALSSFSEPVAITTFRRLYEAAFAGLAWYQPYLSDDEVAAELVDPADLLFLFEGSNPAGFLWMRWPEIACGEIEPIGLVAAYQARGLSRPFLLAGLHSLADQGASLVTVGVWSGNHRAIRLYQGLGFRHTGSLTYLAFDLGRT